MSLDQNANIIVVDDDPEILEILEIMLVDAGYKVKTAKSGEEMRACINRQMPDLVILDLKLPGEHGFDLAKQLRRDKNIGIIILTGSADSANKVVGLEIGADDYVSKPFEKRELLARVRSVLRRVLQISDPSKSADMSVAKFSGWSLDLTAHELISPDTKEIRLTSYEFQLLEILVRNANRVMSRDQIMENITGRDWMPSNRSVDVIVGRLRKKIEKEPDKPSLIKTIRSVGYKFTTRVSYS